MPVHPSLPCSPAAQRELVMEKERFLRGEEPDPSHVRDIIRRSWARSAQSGVTIDNNATVTLDEGLLRHLREHNRDLIQCTTEVFRRMFADITPFASNMALANAEGIILAAFVPETEKQRLPETVIGALSRENIIGTNGIGTCIAEGCPVEILGAEHYRRLGEMWSCSAAPIRDEQHNLIAVLNVGQRRDHYHVHTFGMVKAAAYAISEQMRLRALLRRQETIMELLDDGILVLGRSGVIRMMNTNAARIMGLEAPATDCPVTAFIRESPFLDSILRTSSPIRDREARFDFVAAPRGCIYSVLPVDGNDDITLVLRESQRMRKLAVRMTGNRATYTFDSIAGQSQSLKRAIEEARTVAPRSTTVLLLGESGTGKELFAQSIHNAGSSASGPFISVNCGAIPRSLLESELFGYEYGAFTGADKSGKPGKFELAAGGSIFLDEIGEMPLDAQVALLHLLQNGEVTRVGGSVRRRVDTRVIAATNKNLEKMTKDGTFREDLFYRLNVYPIVIPPLRERHGDIPLLARMFLNTMAGNLKKTFPGFTDDALAVMEHYAWPGNVRELENAVERMVNIAPEGWLAADALPPSLMREQRNREEPPARPRAHGESPAPLNSYLSSREAEYIRNTLLETGGNVRRAAGLLGLSRPWLYQKMRELGLNIAEIRDAAKKRDSFPQENAAGE